jgi:hypothetical protein
MFKPHDSSRQNCCKKRKKNRQNRPTKKQRQGLRFESLEDRRVMALVGVGALDQPVIGYNSGGTVSYDQVSNQFSLAATPLSLTNSLGTNTFDFGALNINIVVDESGSLVGGVAGDDLVLTGAVDVDGDFVADFTGTLLTGEVLAFGSQDSGGITDIYDYKFSITGGLLASLYAGKDLGVITTSENSNFVGDFNVNFGGNAKGSMGGIEQDAPDPGRISGTKLAEITKCECDQWGNETKTTVIEAHAGVVINLYADLDGDGELDDNEDDVVLATDTTDANGNYSFENLVAGDYIVQEQIPDGYIPLTADTIGVEVLPGDDIGDVDFFNKLVKASVGNYFFIDTNVNGLQDAGDFGVNGVTVKLLDKDGKVIDTAVTGFDNEGNAGYYLFYNLDAGNYMIEFVVPTGVTFTIKDVGMNSNDTADSDANSNGRTNSFYLGTNQHRRDIDAGVKPEVCVEQTVYKVKDYFDYCQRAKAGLIKGVTLEYNPTSEELYVEVKVKTENGRLADGFTIVLDNGGSIDGSDEDTLAVFYFDATASQPVLNVFGYNSRGDASSFRDSNGHLGSQDPDRIATSKNNSSGWVKELSVNTYNGLRTFKFRIDASEINDNVPLQNADWEGTGIGRYASFALDTFDGLTTAYNIAGFLTKWNFCYQGYMDACKVQTQKCTIQTKEAIDEFFDEWGWDVTDWNGSSDGDISDATWEGSVDACHCDDDCDKDCGDRDNDCDRDRDRDCGGHKQFHKSFSKKFSRWC